MQEISLKELCKQCDVTRRMVQGYEKNGLLKSCGTNKYGHLLYSIEDVERVKQIRFQQKIGLSLQEIVNVQEMSESEKIQLYRRKLLELKDRRKEIDELILALEKYYKI